MNIDFIYFKLIDFPIFNVADCYVTIAVILFVMMVATRLAVGKLLQMTQK